jgi:predicted phage terminase large subunit-like protein
MPPEGINEEWLREQAEKSLERQRILEEAEALGKSMMPFVLAAWPHLKPNETYRHNWHIEAICEHLEAVSRGDITRLQVWVPPGTMKSLTVSVLWHAWEWTTRPWIRYWGGSYETRLAGRLSAMSRNLMMTRWYQERWGHSFRFVRDAEHYYENDQGGTRMATSPESTGTGEHGHRIKIDDPINAKAADATSKTVLEGANEWYDGTVSSRGLDGTHPEIPEHARVIIMQRLHENDLAAHVLEIEDWEVLCLPERYEDNHPFVWRGRAGHRSHKERGSILGEGDRREEGELLWPDRRSEKASNAMAKSLGAHRAGGQLQQRPAPREGQLLKRHWWRFFEPTLFTDPTLASRRPKFRMVVISVDTPLRDKESNDYVAIQAWGVVGSSRYLLDLRKDRMTKPQAQRAIVEMSRFVRGLYPRCMHKILIENAGYGPELIVDLKRELPGVTKIDPQQDGTKWMRAEAASGDLESGNCFLPGRRDGEDELSLPSESNSAAIRDFIESCAIFDNGTHDDDVDAWSQCMNWLRARDFVRGRTGSPFKRRRQRVAA